MKYYELCTECGNEFPLEHVCGSCKTVFVVMAVRHMELDQAAGPFSTLEEADAWREKYDGCFFVVQVKNPMQFERQFEGGENNV